MLKVYHQVMGEGALEKILEEGAILPAAYRIDPDLIWKECSKDLENWLMGSQSPDPRLREVLHFMISEAITRIQLHQRDIGLAAQSSVTKLRCADIIMGDAWNVFLSPEGFVFKGPKTGFVFDARELLAHGAHVRLLDFIYKYHDAIRDVATDISWWRWGHMVPDLGLLLRDKVEEYTSRLRKSGDAAEEFLIKARRSKRWASEMELVWNGPLPVSLAAEVWRDGQMEPVMRTSS